MIRTYNHWLENDHTCKWISDNFPGMMTNVLFLENCLKTIWKGFVQMLYRFAITVLLSMELIFETGLKNIIFLVYWTVNTASFRPWEPCLDLWGYWNLRKNVGKPAEIPCCSSNVCSQVVLVQMHNAQQLHQMHNTYATGEQCWCKVQ